MINKIILVGNAGREAEVRNLENGATVAKFSIATNESYKDKADEWQTVTEWHNVVAWRFLAERAQKSIKKGTLVYVEGKLTHRKYTDKDGNERRATEVVASVLKILEKRESSGGDYSNFPTAEPPFTSGSSTPATSDSKVDDDDLPF